jgi:hypothetical protein
MRRSGMLERFRGQLSFANVMSALAVFIALGGAGYAAGLAKNSVDAAQIKRNAVRAAEIKANAVRGAEIRNGAVGPAEVADGSLTGAELFDESLGSADIAGLGPGDLEDESLGPADVNGLGSSDIEDGSLGTQDLADEAITGPKVDDGSLTEQDAAPGSFLAGEVRVRRVDSTAPDGTATPAVAKCEPGETLIGGSVNLQDPTHPDARIAVSRPSLSNGALVPPSGAVYPSGFEEWKGTVFNPATPASANAAFRVWAICTENEPPPPPPPEPPPPEPPLPPGGPPPPPPPPD